MQRMSFSGRLKSKESVVYVTKSNTFCITPLNRRFNPSLRARAESDSYYNKPQTVPAEILYIFS